MQWGAVLLASFALWFWLRSTLPSAPAEAAVSRIDRTESGVIGAEHAGLSLASREWPAAEASAAFAVTSWYVPPPPPPAPPAPAPEAPKPPPLPFKYLGLITLNGKDVVPQILHADRVVALQVGALIDERYEYQGMQAGSLVFMYLPMKMKQRLAVTGGD